jgi:uncharacterized protein (TIGR03437 family)
MAAAPNSPVLFRRPICPRQITLAAAIVLLLCPAVSAQQATPPNLKVAFIGDQGLNADSIAVLNLIKLENAQAVLHSGDLEYTDNPAGWNAQINGVLGPDFPYFVTIGNHDELKWRGAAGYQQFIIDRFNRLGIVWSGDLGVQSTFHFKGLFFVSTPPGIGSGFDAGASDAFIRQQLAADNSVWTIASWHKDQQLMQVGGKPDETGWNVYEEARKGGAIIATAHEHSYSRTYLLSSMINQTIVSTSNVLALTKGNSFAFVSGLGGASIRPQLLAGNWWASILAATCIAGDPVCQTTASPGALFGVFNVDGQPNKAFFYFKDTSGRVTDSFTVISLVELPSISALAPASIAAGAPSFTLTIDGANFGNQTVVRWNGSDRPTTLISPTQISATISATDIAATGTATVTVLSPGGSSSSSSFTITPAIPLIASIFPATAEAGANGFTLSITGDNFRNSSVVRWNNSDRPTTFVSPTQLTAAISYTDVLNTGTAAISVVNPAGGSNNQTLTIGPPSISLFTEQNSQRAVALDAVSLTRDPFVFAGPNNFATDKRPRVMIFSPNLQLTPGELLSSVTARGEDAQHHIYSMPVEFVGFIPGLNAVTQIVFRIPDELKTADSFWVSVCYGSAASNKALINLKPSN